MKRTLLTLILFVSIAGAQTKDDAQWITKAQVDLAFLMALRNQQQTKVSGLDSTRPMKITTRRLMSAAAAYAWLELYSRYEKECWDDSTSAFDSWKWDSTESAKQGRSVMRRTPIWEHHHWPTFEGFIHWLRRLE
jgi:hypothetical protein